MLADLSSKPVLLAAEPDAPEPDYGWIEAKPLSGISQVGRCGIVLCVEKFHEKPGPDTAAELLTQGGLWNTMIMAVSIRTLWSLTHCILGSMMRHFEVLHQLLLAVKTGWVRPVQEQSVLERIYSAMECADFSRDVLQKSAQEALVLP